jgi:hypothetical protein
MLLSPRYFKHSARLLCAPRDDNFHSSKMADMQQPQLPPPNPNAPLQGAAQSIDRQGLLIIIWVCFSMATVFLGIRLSVRWTQNRGFLPDDCWVIFAWLSVLTMAILQTQQMDSLWYTTYLIAGRLDFTDVEGISKMQIELKRWQFPIIKLFWTTLWAIKASFLALFYRVIKPLPVLRKLWYAVCVFCALAYIGCWLASALTCTPPGQYFKAGTYLGLWHLEDSH